MAIDFSSSSIFLAPFARQIRAGAAAAVARQFRSNEDGIYIHFLFHMDKLASSFSSLSLFRKKKNFVRQRVYIIFIRLSRFYLLLFVLALVDVCVFNGYDLSAIRGDKDATVTKRRYRI